MDSGATYTTLPASLLRDLGVESRSDRTFVLADGSRIRRDFGQTWIRLEGEEYYPLLSSGMMARCRCWAR